VGGTASTNEDGRTWQRRFQLDRLGRSLRHLGRHLTWLADREIGVRSLQEAIDTTTPDGSLSSTSLLPWLNSNVTSSGNARPPDWPRPGPVAAMVAGRWS
jgi:Resolvase, N terminal domain